ncbi:MAG: periplasmic heavy metal sensor [Polyangiaceae bacterium]|nr:periplasmic heavy metal sensor [Polyangiaceae bacterium]
MFGFFVGTACLIGLVYTLRRGACHGGFGYRNYARFAGCGGYDTRSCAWNDHDVEGERGHPFRSHGREHWQHGAPPMAFFFLRRVFQALDTTPGQEKVIRAAVEELVEVMRKHRGELQKSREDIARVMRSSSFDETAMGELFARHDASLDALRKAAVGALAKTHEALDEEQRRRFADMIERAGGFGFRGGWA